MAYEKKKVKKLPKPKKQAAKPEPKKSAKKSEPQKPKTERVDSIDMAPKSSRKIKREQAQDKPIKKRGLKLIEGGETARERVKKGNLITMVVCLLVVVALVTAHLLLPTGLVEWTRNRVAEMGAGTLPAEVGGVKALNMQRAGGRVNVLTDTEMLVYNRSGKLVTTVQHGYSSPVMKVSSERALIFDCGGKGVRVDTSADNIFNEKLEQTVLCADISDRGAFAIATTSEEYTAAMSYYNKNGTFVYRWNSSGQVITNVAMSPDGGSVAVFTVTSVSGEFVTTLHIFDSNGSTRGTATLKGCCILNSYVTKNRVYGIGADCVVSFDWDCGDEKRLQYSSISFIDTQSSRGLLVVEGAANSTAEVYVIDGDGNQSRRLELDRPIIDAALDRDGIYILTGTTVEYVPFEGQSVALGQIGYEYCFISSFGGSVMTLSDMQLQRFGR